MRYFTTMMLTVAILFIASSCGDKEEKTCDADVVADVKEEKKDEKDVVDSPDDATATKADTVSTPADVSGTNG